MAFLLFALLGLVALGVLHLVMLRGQPGRIVPFCAAGAVAHLVIGLAMAGPGLVAQNARSLATLPWWPVLALGFFCVGAIVSLAWVGVVRGLAWLASSRAQGPPPTRS